MQLCALCAICGVWVMGMYWRNAFLVNTPWQWHVISTDAIHFCECISPLCLISPNFIALSRPSYIFSIIFLFPLGSLCGQFELWFCLIKYRIHKCMVTEECGNEEVCRMEEERSRERRRTGEKYHTANDWLSIFLYRSLIISFYLILLPSPPPPPLLSFPPSLHP